MGASSPALIYAPRPMRIHPTGASIELGAAGIATVAAGILAQQAAIIAWGGALIVGLAIARAVTELSVERVRAAGFEMLWRAEPRLVRVRRGERIDIEAEIRNRDTRATRYVQLRPVCSPMLEVELSPTHGEVPAGGRLRVKVSVHALRVGRHGLHGLSLEVHGNTGLFEVPLTFANPFGVEVLPQVFSPRAFAARGGRSRVLAEVGRAGPLAGDGNELRELREHQAGDPFKRIAWKASARRGRLMVREYEQEERDVVWLLLDASVELWSGKPGTSPLDLAIDEVAAVAQRHLARGDSVGLGILASRPLAWVEPARGPQHGAKLLSTLAHDTACYASERSDLDESDVAVRVLEHMRPLDPTLASQLRPSELDRLMRRAERLRGRAPFQVAAPEAPSPRERVLRQYLAAFGIHAPPRMESERQRTDQQLALSLHKLRRQRPHASVIYLWSPAPDAFARAELGRVLRQFPQRRANLVWVSMDHEPSLPERAESPQADAVAEAVALRLKIARQRGERVLRGLGIRVAKVRSAPSSPDPANSPPSNSA